MKKHINRYVIGIIICSIFFLLTYAHRFYKSKVITKQVTLSSTPRYDYTISKGIHYHVEISFYEMSQKLKIAGINYQYLEHPKFLKEVKKDTAVTIVYADDLIVQLSKYGYQYMDPNASSYHWNQNVIYARVLFIAALFTCAIPVLLRKIVGEARFLFITKYFAFILIPVLTISYLITAIFIDSKFTDSKWTKFPVETRKSY